MWFGDFFQTQAIASPLSPFPSIFLELKLKCFILQFSLIFYSLLLIKGVAKGSAYPGFNYHHDSGARVVSLLIFRSNQDFSQELEGSQLARSYFNGGHYILFLFLFSFLNFILEFDMVSFYISPSQSLIFLPL